MEDEAGRVLELVRQNETGELGRERIEKEYERIEETLAWCLEHDAHRGLEIAAHLRAFWGSTGRFNAGRVWLQKLLAAGQEPGDAVRARALSAASLLAFRQGDNEEAQRLATDALTVARQIDDPERVVDALVGLARVGLRDEDPERVRQLSGEARAVARQASRPDLEKLPLHCLAEATRMAGDFEGARRLYEESLALNRALDDQSMITTEMVNLASVELHEEKYDDAIGRLQESLRRARADKNLYLLPYCIMGLGEVAAVRGRDEQAAMLVGAATSIFESTGQQIDPADRDVYERCVSTLRQTLGQRAFETCWSQGAALSVDQAVEAALAGEESTHGVA